MRIGAAQIRSVPGDVDANIARHLTVAALAAEHGADFVFFPELSLSGYLTSRASEVAMPAGDARLDGFGRFCDDQRMGIAIGVPAAAPEGVQISMLVFQPGEPRKVYSKQMLHADELPWFVAGAEQLLLQLNGMTVALAICFEALQPAHGAHAASLGADVYLASVAKSASGVDKALAHFPELARKHSMAVIMANATGPCEGFEAAGGSAAWSNSGNLIAQAGAQDEGLLLVDTQSASAEWIPGGAASDPDAQ